MQQALLYVPEIFSWMPSVIHYLNLSVERADVHAGTEWGATISTRCIMYDHVLMFEVAWLVGFDGPKGEGNGQW